MTTPVAGRPTRAIIDATAVRDNFIRVRAGVRHGAAILAVVKADAYGHGAALVAPILAAAGADWFGVATVEEGIELRQCGVRAPILVLGGASGGDVAALKEHQLSVALLDSAMARNLARTLGSGRVRIHIKVDTGMGRLGILPHDLPALLDELRDTPCFEIEGCFSHFANADRVDRECSNNQIRVFQAALDTIDTAGIRVPWLHLANSAATLSRPDTHFSLVRPGIVLYGIPPVCTPAPPGLKPVMSLTSRIIQLKTVPADFSISYSQTFVTRRPSRIAVIPIGYADGYPRRLSNRASMLVRGHRAPVVGAVCMDLTMIDVTDIPGVEVGDEVVLWGQQNGAEITIQEVAEWQETVPYEVLTRLGKRIPRVLK